MKDKRSFRENYVGATYIGDRRCRFLVWAPAAAKVEVSLTHPEKRLAPLDRMDRGYHGAVIDGIQPGSLYFYRLDGRLDRPDPASRHQPQGVHGPSEVINPRFEWHDGCWPGLPLEDYVTYELHVGTFSESGTLDGVIAHLEYLKDLGVTALDLMPLAQFPGARNWGYDGVYPFAVQNTYGGPAGMKRLVDACHQKGLAVVLDVVYNHFGPEGNYITDFGPYCTDKYVTPWGRAINFDGPGSDEVRRFFVDNALFWTVEFHVDALRLDAVHAIADLSPRPFLQDLADSVHARGYRLNRRIFLIAESDRNDARLVTSQEKGGLGLDGQWSDDFHHSLHTLITSERQGYYEDFGHMEDMVKAFREGFVYSGQHSRHRSRRHGVSSRDIPAWRLIVFSQDHDQIGNRMRGERLSRLVSFDMLKLAAGAVLLSPFLPLLFMGEEYGETAPFLYFVDHLDPALAEAVHRGRRDEFAAFAWQGDPPPPQREDTFLLSRLDHQLRGREGPHQTLLRFYRELTRLRRELPALSHLSKDDMDVQGSEKDMTLVLRRWSESQQVVVAFNFGAGEASPQAVAPAGTWCKELDSADRRWLGPGHESAAKRESDGKLTLPLRPWSFALLTHEVEPNGRIRGHGN